MPNACGGRARWRCGEAATAIAAVKPKEIDRPWSPAITGEGEAEPTLVAPRPVAPRAVDATPSEADLQAEE
jgi:competence protein ComEC